jgi:hypothetical protein
MSSGSSLTSKLNDKIIKMLSKSHETIPLKEQLIIKPIILVDLTSNIFFSLVLILQNFVTKGSQSLEVTGVSLSAFHCPRCASADASSYQCAG